jgi:ABC-type antimicrobial peptide transport system permease subunit
MRLWVLSLAPEMAIWRAVGARRWRVVRMVLGRTLVAGAAGVLLGLWLGPACWEAVRALVPGLGVWQPGVLLPLALLLIFTALLGAVLPLADLLRRPPALLFGVHED